MSWTITNLEEYSKSNMLQEHYLNAHLHTCYMLLEQCAFQIWSWSIFNFFQIINGSGLYSPGAAGPGPYDPRAAEPGP